MSNHTFRKGMAKNKNLYFALLFFHEVMKVDKKYINKYI